MYQKQTLRGGAGDHTPIPLYIHVLGGFGFFGVSTCYPLGHENHFLELLFKVCLKVIANSWSHIFRRLETVKVSAAWHGFETDNCMPNGVTAGQLLRVWIKWANEHPEDLHFEASSLVLNAYIEAFPCD